MENNTEDTITMNFSHIYRENYIHISEKKNCYLWTLSKNESQQSRTKTLYYYGKLKKANVRIRETVKVTEELQITQEDVKILYHSGKVTLLCRIPKKP